MNRTYMSSHSFIRENGEIYIGFEDSYSDGTKSMTWRLFSLVE